MATWNLSTGHTADVIEARDTAVEPLPFAIGWPTRRNYEVGDDVILTSADGCVFIGHLSDVDTDRLRIYVELD